MHTHSHLGKKRVDLRVRQYVNTVCRVTFSFKHAPHRHSLYPPDERFITSWLAL